MSGAWGCPHEVDGICQRVNGAYCKPGMRGCVLAGKVEFEDGKQPVPRWPSGTRSDGGRSEPGRDADDARRKP